MSHCDINKMIYFKISIQAAPVTSTVPMVAMVVLIQFANAR